MRNEKAKSKTGIRNFMRLGAMPRWGSLNRALLIILVLLFFLTACSASTNETADIQAWTDILENKQAALEAPYPDEDYSGYGLTWYQVFVYSFYDSDGDGIGDLRGVTERLDYIQSLGFDGIWLSPIHPSNTYHKYNVSDYYSIDAAYGTLDDFDALIEACHALGLRVLLDLVINHTDINHSWFAENPGFYNIADAQGNGRWESLPDGRYYECQFWDQMPDLNLENMELRSELELMFSFWLERGVDGFRLDATGEYVSGNTAKNIEILTWLNVSIKAIKADAYIVGEFWETTNILYEYYESGIDSFFSFPFAGSDGAIARLLLQSSVSIEDYFSRTALALDSALKLNPNATNAPFFTNHDMSRAAGFLRRDANLIKTAWGLSLMQPGNAFVYYGEELGMSGSGIDENKRAPMFWTDEEFAIGMTSGPPGMDAATHSFPPAIQQIGDPGSIYSYIRDAVHLRRKYPHIGSGSFSIIPTEAGRKAGAVMRSWLGSEIIIAYNVSSEAVEISLPGTIQDILSATGEQAEKEGTTLTLPGFCIVILST